MNRENFLREVNWINNLQLRASYGIGGNIGRHTAPYMTAQYYPGNLGNTGAVLAPPNKDIRWEKTRTINVGVDFDLLRNRLWGSLEYYHKKSTDLLAIINGSPTQGFGYATLTTNNGAIDNSGLELNLSGQIIRKADLVWTSTLLYAYNRNRVGSIPNEDGIIHGETGTIYNNNPEFYRAQNGKVIGYFYGYQTAGIFQNQKEIDDWRAAGNGFLQANPQPGDVRFVDADRNGLIDDADKADLGNGLPDFTYGFNVSLNWRNFDLSLVASGAAGMQIVQSYRDPGNQYANYTSRILDRWTGEGTSNTIPRVTNQNINWQFSDLFVHDADYLRLSNLTIGYNFAPLINQSWLSNCRVYFQIQNLATFTKYDGMDPEIGYGTSDWVSGVDVGYYPRPRTFLFGVNLGF